MRGSDLVRRTNVRRSIALTPAMLGAAAPTLAEWAPTRPVERAGAERRELMRQAGFMSGSARGPADARQRRHAAEADND